MFGKGCIKTHSQTQETVAPLSGESEFYGIVKPETMGLSVKGLKADLGLEVKVQANVDSRAAKQKRIAKRSGESEAHRGARFVGAGPGRQRMVGDQEDEGR